MSRAEQPHLVTQRQVLRLIAARLGLYAVGAGLIVLAVLADWHWL